MSRKLKKCKIKTHKKPSVSTKNVTKKSGKISLLTYNEKRCYYYYIYITKGETLQRKQQKTLQRKQQKTLQRKQKKTLQRKQQKLNQKFLNNSHKGRKKR